MAAQRTGRGGGVKATGNTAYAQELAAWTDLRRGFTAAERRAPGYAAEHAALAELAAHPTTADLAAAYREARAWQAGRA